MSLANIQPLDVGHEYLAPGELDEGDLLALRVRLHDMHELVEGSRLWTSKAVEADLPHDWSDIVLGTQRYHGARTKTGIAEDLIIETFLSPQDRNPMIRYKVADRPGQRAISITEPVMKDRSNYVSSASTLSERLALITRWMDLTTRPIFQYHAFGDDESKTTELIRAERGQATAIHARHIISNLLASDPSHTLHTASP